MELGKCIYEPVSFGVDWLTCTAKAGAPSLAFEVLADEVFSDEKRSGRDVAASNRLGYAGHSVDGFFHGRRPDGNLLIISGPRCYPLARHAIAKSTGVSRIDLQITLWTGGEQPHLAEHAYHTLKRIRPKNGRPPTMTLVKGFPDGETLNVNRRVSDLCIRVYDKASEAKLGLARTIWRYELELKRKLAGAAASRIAADDCPPSWIYNEVHRRVTDKGIEWPGPTNWYRPQDEQLLLRGHGDNLTWIRDNLSKCIARRINEHGLSIVLGALGIDKLVEPRRSTREALVA